MSHEEEAVAILMNTKMLTLCYVILHLLLISLQSVKKENSSVKRVACALIMISFVTAFISVQMAVMKISQNVVRRTVMQ